MVVTLPQLIQIMPGARLRAGIFLPAICARHRTSHFLRMVGA